MARRRPTNETEAGGPAPLGTVLAAFLSHSGLAAAMKNPALHEAWPRVVGPGIAQHTGVAGFRRGVLEVAVDSSALMSDIQFHKSALLAALRAEVRKPFVSSIVFLLKPMQEDDDAERTDD